VTKTNVASFSVYLRLGSVKRMINFACHAAKGERERHILDGTVIKKSAGIRFKE
jgi:hypothetical protein